MPTKKRANPDHNSPPKVKDKKNKQDDMCLICNSTIVEENENQMGEEAIFCEGNCQGWLHRKCAGITNVYFNKLTKSNNKFLCVYCRLFEQASLVEELQEEVKNLKAKLEEGTPSPTNLDSQNMETGPSAITDSSNPPINLEGIRREINLLTSSVRNQQKILDNKERENRMNNLVIVGLKEEDDNEDVVAVTSSIFASKLGLDNVAIAKAKRLGKSDNKKRPILVTFSTQSDRKEVLENRKKLAGSDIYINFDLTREQIKELQNLRKLRKKLLQHEAFKNKKITIYRNKLHTDRIPISAESLLEAGITE